MDVQPLFGPMLIGVFLAMILYGVLILQVLYLFVVEMIHSGFAMAIMYQPLIIHFGEEQAITRFPAALAAEPILGVAVSTPIQLFIAYRIYRLQKSIWIALLVTILAILSCCGGVWTTIRVLSYRVFAKKPETHPPVMLWLIGSATADILITASLSYSLWVRRTGIRATDAIITRIIIYTIQTGLITSIAAILVVVLLIALPNLTVNFIFDVTLVKLYAITLLSSLNGRVSLNEEWNQRNLLFDNPFPSTRAGASRIEVSSAYLLNRRQPGPSLSVQGWQTQTKSGTIKFAPGNDYWISGTIVAA
ncbi:hypothetical protein CVT24_005487 [Panaeolus cyanescens]|uniref:DUF6534 domain-containing protein n=1 Tax=Panaeolus cyanescens TaxID=181874 RepID=A0A409YC92_9AGAR|nr:hypothetical protein CVT24_005487 [Panaeolus cyanescens]